MERKSDKIKPAETARDARLKAALKANLGRRKAQAKARSADMSDPNGRSQNKEQKD